VLRRRGFGFVRCGPAARGLEQRGSYQAKPVSLGPSCGYVSCV
jgi:hypothetical protein